jgi:hypothetical protein
MITSPMRTLDLATMTAVTASTGRRYELNDRLDGPPPGGAQDVIARAMTAWRVARPPPAAPLSDAEIVRLLGLADPPAPTTGAAEPFKAAAAKDRR